MFSYFACCHNSFLVMCFNDWERGHSLGMENVDSEVKLRLDQSDSLGQMLIAKCDIARA